MANPLICSYTKCIRPLLDTVNGLHQQNILEEGVELPTIVVVGDQSSGKASVIESLADINLPQGEESIEDAIQVVTNQIAGKGKSYSDTPFTLMFHKHGVPELTIIDLSECPLASAARETGYFSSITMSYIHPSNNILLNMLSAGSDLSISQSTRMCRQVDDRGEHTLS
ncbi:putative dynamin-related protein 4A [Platanthera zijinensis]|uniref:Dynamin-related protein 4A n=1 Tax=Platanthera zijinensis TaxID=2320716 RepID=A0AAP0BZS6_9ASPA